jgi:hypothetical protein
MLFRWVLNNMKPVNPVNLVSFFFFYFILICQSRIKYKKDQVDLLIKK